MATIKDIADALGVSRGTVDRALHNRAEVSADVRERVLEKAKELGYRSNKAGRLLSVCKKTKTIGVLMPSVNNPFFDDVKRGLVEAEREYKDFGFSLKIVDVAGFDQEIHLDAIERLSKECDALILATVDEEKINLFLDSLDIPFAAMNTDISAREKKFYVGSDYYKKGALNAGLLHLCAKEMPRILIVQGSRAMKGHSEAVKGFIETLDKNKIEYKLVAECLSEDDDEISLRAVERELDLRPDINSIYVVAAGASGVVKAVGSRHILVFASDDVASVKELVKQDKIAWIVCQEPFVQGYQSMKKMCEHLINPFDTCTSYYIKHVVKIKENIEE